MKIYAILYPSQSRPAGVGKGVECLRGQMAVVLLVTLMASLCVNVVLGVPLTNGLSNGSTIMENASVSESEALCLCTETGIQGQNCSATVKPCKPCQKGWTHLEGKCFYFSDDKLDWKNSKEACAFIGSHLTILLTAQQHDHVNEVVHGAGGLDYHYWIGLSDSEEEGVWKWVDNTVVNKTYWNEWSKEPNNHESGGPDGEDCAVLESHTKSWFDVPCNFSYKRICEKDANHLVRKPCKPCPEGWTHLEGKCYYFSKDKLDWNNSKEACVSMGSHLTILLTDQQHDHLEEVVHGAGWLSYHYWIGLSDSEEEGVWKWVDNTVVNKTYWNERSKEPNNHESGGPFGEDCAVLESHTKSWFDVPCDFSYKRICEMDAVNVDRTCTTVT